MPSPRNFDSQYWHWRLSVMCMPRPLKTDADMPCPLRQDKGDVTKNCQYETHTSPYILSLSFNSFKLCSHHDHWCVLRAPITLLCNTGCYFNNFSPLQFRFVFHTWSHAVLDRPIVWRSLRCVCINCYRIILKNCLVSNLWSIIRRYKSSGDWLINKLCINASVCSECKIYGLGNIVGVFYPWGKERPLQSWQR